MYVYAVYVPWCDVMCVCVSICKCLCCCCCCCCVYFLFLVAAAAAAAVVSSIFVSRAYFAYTLTHTHYIIQLWLGLISSPSPFVLFCFFSISFFPLLITHIYLNRIRTGVCGCVLLLLNACACTMFMCCCPVWRFFHSFFRFAHFLYFIILLMFVCVYRKSQCIRTLILITHISWLLFMYFLLLLLLSFYLLGAFSICYVSICARILTVDFWNEIFM